MSDLQHLTHFYVKQKIIMVANRYEIRAAAADGSEGPVIAMAQQKRFAFKEQVVFKDESGATVFGFRARRRIDVGATYDVTDANGNDIGWFRKQFGASLLRSTWSIGSAGVEATGRERSQGVAIARRVWEQLPVVGQLPSPFLFHFDFVDDASGEVVMSSVRARSLRDRYEVTVPGGRLDGRVAAAMAVALDALQSR